MIQMDSTRLLVWDPVAVIPMTAGTGVRVVKSVGMGSPIIIGARLAETADGVEEAAGGNAVGIHGVGWCRIDILVTL